MSAYYSIYRPRKDERLSWPSWSTYSLRFIHISGHPSAAGQARDRKVRRGITGVLPLCYATNQPVDEKYTAMFYRLETCMVMKTVGTPRYSANPAVMGTKSVILLRECVWHIRCYCRNGDSHLRYTAKTCLYNHLRINFDLFGWTYSRRQTDTTVRRLRWWTYVPSRSLSDCLNYRETTFQTFTLLRLCFQRFQNM